MTLFIRFAGLLILMVLYSTLHATELLWNADTIEDIIYKSTSEIDISGKFRDIDPMKWVKSPSDFNAVINKLKQFPLEDKYLHFRTRLKKINAGRGIRVQMVGIPVKFEGEPTDEIEQELRYSISASKNAIVLQGDFDLSGDSTELTFYRTTKEHNLLTQMFYLPKGKIEVGQSWSLPIQLVTLGPGIFVQNSESYNNVKLVAVRKTDHGTVAELQYLISEKVDGYLERVLNTDKGRPPFSINISMFGYGEFLIEKGYWLRQVMVNSYKATGKTKMNKQHLSAMVLNEK